VLWQKTSDPACFAVKTLNSAYMECVVVKEQFQHAGMCGDRKRQVQHAGMCHSQNVRFSMSVMCCSQKRPIQLAWVRFKAIC
jgi:hypothetical protein